MKKYINKITHADFDKISKEIPDNYIDLVLTDPPFGVGKTWMKNKRTYHYGKNIDWNNKKIKKSTFKEIFRISKNQIIFGGNYYTGLLPITNSWIIWDKGINVEETNFSECELAWTSFNIPMRKVYVQWDGGKKGIETGTKNIHPYQRPVKLYTWCLQKYSQKNDLILDCFSGSGSVAIACHQMGRRFVSIEKEEEYIKPSRERLATAKMQTTLDLTV